MKMMAAISTHGDELIRITCHKSYVYFQERYEMPLEYICISTPWRRELHLKGRRR